MNVFLLSKSRIFFKFSHCFISSVLVLHSCSLQDSNVFLNFDWFLGFDPWSYITITSLR